MRGIPVLPNLYHENYEINSFDIEFLKEENLSTTKKRQLEIPMDCRITQRTDNMSNTSLLPVQ